MTPRCLNYTQLYTIKCVLSFVCCDHEKNSEDASIIRSKIGLVCKVLKNILFIVLTSFSGVYTLWKSFLLTMCEILDMTASPDLCITQCVLDMTCLKYFCVYDVFYLAQIVLALSLLVCTSLQSVLLSVLQEVWRPSLIRVQGFTEISLLTGFASKSRFSWTCLISLKYFLHCLSLFALPCTSLVLSVLQEVWNLHWSVSKGFFWLNLRHRADLVEREWRLDCFVLRI